MVGTFLFIMVGLSVPPSLIFSLIVYDGNHRIVIENISSYMHDVIQKTKEVKSNFL